ncbi:ABA4-like family protein, partial [Streptomyces sparsus]
MHSFLFQLSFLLAAPVWTLLILAPGHRLTERVAASVWPLVPLLAVYLLLAVQVMPQLWAAVSRPDLDVFQALIAHPAGAAALWAQVIAWDLFLGMWMYREGRARGVHPVVMGPVLLLSVLLSPVGVGLFLLIRAGRELRTPPPAAPVTEVPPG